MSIVMQKSLIRWLRQKGIAKVRGDLQSEGRCVSWTSRRSPEGSITGENTLSMRVVGGATSSRSVGGFAFRRSSRWCQTPAEKLAESELMCKGRWGSGECQTPDEEKCEGAEVGCKTPVGQGSIPSLEFEDTPLRSSSPTCPATPVEHTPNPKVETPVESFFTPVDETPTEKCQTPGSNVKTGNVRPRAIGFKWSDIGALSNNINMLCHQNWNLSYSTSEDFIEYCSKGDADFQFVNLVSWRYLWNCILTQHYFVFRIKIRILTKIKKWRLLQTVGTLCLQTCWTIWQTGFDSTSQLGNIFLSTGKMNIFVKSRFLTATLEQVDCASFRNGHWYTLKI
jgi:hypothetical protein